VAYILVARTDPTSVDQSASPEQNATILVEIRELLKEMNKRQAASGVFRI
jgi:hypothetical protein